MGEGTLGISASLRYVPDIEFTTGELIALGKAAARKGGISFLHQRSESSRVLESRDELFRIAREGRIPLDAWHPKTAYAKNHGRMRKVLGRFRAARAEELNAAANGIDACLPPWVREGGRENLRPFEEAVRRMTSFPAARVRLADRGSSAPASPPTSPFSTR